MYKECLTYIRTSQWTVKVGRIYGPQTLVKNRRKATLGNSPKVTTSYADISSAESPAAPSRKGLGVNYEDVKQRKLKKKFIERQIDSFAVRQNRLIYVTLQLHAELFAR
jgi:hypothetical protein